MEINLELHLEAVRDLIASNQRLETSVSALTDAVTGLKAVVAANTTAVSAIPSASDVATAVTDITAATAQLATNNTTLTGDVPPVVIL
jgi:hypothetical protein